jgi:AraC-like DNA-binding protein
LQFFTEGAATKPIHTIPAGLAGEVRRSVAGARLHIDHRHSELEFDLVIKGAGSFMLDERNYVLKPGTLIWLVPDQQHRLVRSPGLEMWVVNIRPELIEPERIAQLATRPLRQLPGEELVDLDRLLSQVAQDSDDPAVYNAGITYLAKRAWRASRDSPPARARPMHAAVARALLLLRESGAALSLSELAEAAGAAAPYLSRLLIEHTGRSFVDWRNHIRLDRFIEAYRPGTNLLAAAFDAGFGSYARFNHIFNDVIGCSPSEWVKRGQDRDDGTAAVRPIDYGMPRAPNFSARQRWIGLVPMVAPAITTLLGKTFIDRLLAAAPSDVPDSQEPFELLEARLPAPERKRLIASLRHDHPDLVNDLAQLIDAHDFAATYTQVLAAFGLSATRLLDAVTALFTVVWVASGHGTDPGQPHVEAVRRQVQGTLGAKLARLDRRTAQDAHTALLCHFVIIYRALEAARASGDPRAFDQLRDAATRYGRGAFGGDIADIDLTSRGFVRAGRREVRRKSGMRLSRKVSVPVSG